MKKSWVSEMKRQIFALLILMIYIMIIMVSSSSNYSEADKARVAWFQVTINGEVVDNEHATYPLLVYKGVVYFPMTWDFSSSLGLTTLYTQKNGLEITKSDANRELAQSLTAHNELNKSYEIEFPDFPITVNGEGLDNATEPYPIFMFRDITYFPLTWDFAVNEFGWLYSYSDDTGLVILVDEIEDETEDHIMAINILNDRFGVKGDGVTNDTVAFQNAINSLREGDILYIPEGDYLLDELKIKKDNIVIIGTGNSRLICNQEVYKFVTVAGKNIAISGLEIDGNRKTQRGFNIDRYSSDVVIKGCTVRNIYDNKQAVQVSGIKVYGDCENILIENCLVENVESTPNGKTGDSGGSARGIIVAPLKMDNEGSTFNVTIKDNTIRNIMPREDGDGIVITSNGGTAGRTVATIENNYFENNAKRAVKVFSDNVIVSNNIITHSFDGMDTNYKDGMYSAISVYASNVKVSNNQISGNSYYKPIDVQGTHSGIEIIGNDITITGVGTALPYQGSISFQGSFDDVRVIDNKINRTSSGIYLRIRMNNAVISGNIIKGQDIDYGIFLDDYLYEDFSGIEISDNNIDVAKYAIYLADGSEVTIYDNQAVGGLGTIEVSE